MIHKEMIGKIVWVKCCDSFTCLYSIKHGYIQDYVALAHAFNPDGSNVYNLIVSPFDNPLNIIYCHMDFKGTNWDIVDEG